MDAPTLLCPHTPPSLTANPVVTVLPNPPSPAADTPPSSPDWLWLELVPRERKIFSLNLGYSIIRMTNIRVWNKFFFCADINYIYIGMLQMQLIVAYLIVVVGLRSNGHD